MVWLVKTEYCIGIFLSSAAVNKMKKKIKLQQIEYENYADAYEMLKASEKNESIKIPWEKFMPNRLYQIKSRKCYVVFYNTIQVGFTKMEEIDEFCDQNKINLRFFKARWDVDYETAISIVTRLGADTGRNQILEHCNPVSKRLYRRINQ